mgnify:CR=1 FL=1
MNTVAHSRITVNCPLVLLAKIINEKQYLKVTFYVFKKCNKDFSSNLKLICFNDLKEVSCFEGNVKY